jgi:hypothetical protein
MYKKILLVIIVASFCFCSKQKKSCAEVLYSNEKTGTVSNYTLNIEVNGNKLTKIYFPNGGWLNNSHFIEPDFNSRNQTEFISDKNVKYSVTLINDKLCDF